MAFFADLMRGTGGLLWSAEHRGEVQVGQGATPLTGRVPAHYLGTSPTPSPCSLVRIPRLGPGPPLPDRGSRIRPRRGGLSAGRRHRLHARSADAQSPQAHRSVHDRAVSGHPVVRVERPVHLRRRQARTRHPAEVPQLPQGRHHRLAGGDRDESRPLRSGGRVVRRGRLPRRCAAGAHGHVGDHPAHAGLRDADERLARVLQPAPDPAAGRQPRLQVHPAARGGAQVSAAVRDGVPAHRRVPLVREARAGRAGRVSLAGPRADARRAQRRRAVRRVRRSLPPVTNPALTTRDQNGFVIELEQFSGPLDLLLHLIREDEVDITDLPIAKIADQFLAVINELGLNQAADYLEMAARLLRIKAQLLLPRRLGDDEWEDPRAGLVRRLLEYQQIRELVDWLAQAAARRAEQFGRGFRPEPPEAPPAPLVIELNDLLAAAERGIALIPEPVLHRVVPRPLDVEGATARIEALLAERERCGWLEVVGERPSLVDVLSAFIALLELAKRGALRLSQDGPFTPIVIQRESPREAA